MLTGCASFSQKEGEVWQRLDGGLLENWKSLPVAASMHWPYAWASVSAYLHEEDGKQIDVSADCPDPHHLLRAQGWELWEELPRVGRKSQPASELVRKLQDVHLRAEVWSNREKNVVIVAFGGTAGFEDVAANARWLLPFGAPDAYVAVTDLYAPAFVAALERRAMEPEQQWLKSANIVSTGHSLGAGLAQRFAYSVRPGPNNKAVKEVYGFDPSPVSGKRGVDGWEETAQGLTIFRIYKRGEILAGLRSLLQWANPGNSRNQGQQWIDIRYLDDWSWRTVLPDGWIRAHGMHKFACYLNRNSPPSERSSSSR